MIAQKSLVYSSFGSFESNLNEKASLQSKLPISVFQTSSQRQLYNTTNPAKLIRHSGAHTKNSGDPSNVPQQEQESGASTLNRPTPQLFVRPPLKKTMSSKVPSSSNTTGSKYNVQMDSSQPPENTSGMTPILSAVTSQKAISTRAPLYVPRQMVKGTPLTGGAYGRVSPPANATHTTTQNTSYNQGPQSYVTRKKSSSGYSVDKRQGQDRQNGASKSIRQRELNTARQIQQTKANIEKMLIKKQQNAAMFAQKLVSDMHQQPDSQRLSTEDFDETRNTKWQLSLREKKLPGMIGRGGLVSGKHSASRNVITQNNQNLRGVGGQQPHGDATLASCTNMNDTLKRQKILTKEQQLLSQTNKGRQLMFQQPAMSQKKGDGGDVVMTTGADDAIQVTHFEQTSLQKTVYNNTNSLTTSGPKRIIPKDTLVDKMPPKLDLMRPMARENMVLTPDLSVKKQTSTGGKIFNATPKSSQRKRFDGDQSNRAANNKGKKVNQLTNGGASSRNARNSYLNKTPYRNCSVEYPTAQESLKLNCEATSGHPHTLESQTLGFLNQSQTYQQLQYASKRSTEVSKKDSKQDVFSKKLHGQEQINLKNNAISSVTNKKPEIGTKHPNSSAAPDAVSHNTPKNRPKFEITDQIFSQGGILKKRQMTNHQRQKSQKVCEKGSNPQTQKLLTPSQMGKKDSQKYNQKAGQLKQMKVGIGFSGHQLTTVKEMNTTGVPSNTQRNTLEPKVTPVSPNHKPSKMIKFLTGQQQPRNRVDTKSKRMKLNFGHKAPSAGLATGSQQQSKLVTKTAKYAQQQKQANLTTSTCSPRTKSRMKSPLKIAENSPGQRAELSDGHYKQRALILQASEEPVIEIYHSSCESEDAIVVEERPLREIVKGLTASSKASPVKKDLSFDNNQSLLKSNLKGTPDERLIDGIAPPRKGKATQKSFSLSVVLNNGFQDQLARLESAGIGKPNLASPKDQNGNNTGKRVQFEKIAGGSSHRHVNYASHLSPLQGKEKDDTADALFVEDDSLQKVNKVWAFDVGRQNRGSLLHHAVMHESNEGPLTARSSTSKPSVQQQINSIKMDIDAKTVALSGTPKRRNSNHVEIQEDKAIQESLIVVGNQNPNTMTQFELRQQKAKVKWDYLLNFIQQQRQFLRESNHTTVQGRNQISRTMWTQFNQDYNGSKCVNQAEEQMQKKLIDQIQILNRRSEESEYGASNYTQITDYQIGRHLGSGAYASVKMATHKPTGMVLAIKVYEKFKLNEQSQRKQSVKREINVMKKLQHENVMRMFDVIDSPKQLYIVLEYIQGQMLHSYIEKLLLENNLAEFTLSPASVRPRIHAKGPVNLKGPILDNGPKRLMAEPTVAIIFYQVLQALAFAHSKNVCHRDLKPENIMYNPKTHMVKIIDFGFACISKEKLRIFCGTPSFMSPEIVNKKEYSGSAADVWASGVLLFVMLTGQVPFKATTEKDLYRKIGKGVYSWGKQEQKTQHQAPMASFSLQPNGTIGPDNPILNESPFMANRPIDVNSKVTVNVKDQKTRNGAGGDQSDLVQPQQIGGVSKKQVSREGKDLVRQLLALEQDQRPTAAHVLKTSAWLLKHTALYTHNNIII